MHVLNNGKAVTVQSINRLIDEAKNGFTMVELMVVVGIIGILMAVLLGTFSGSTESARSAKCQANLHTLATAVQSVGMSAHYYPRASTIDYTDDNDEKQTEHGWLGDETDPYLKNAETRRTCFDNGRIWDVMKHERSAFVCPSHQRYAKEHKKGDPLWSYAMSSFFDKPGAVKHTSSGYLRREFGIGKLSRADRYLLFAELPYAQMKVEGTEIQSGNPSGKELDPVLERDSESIGFNHKDGKNVMGHVCFADGHVEKLRAPNSKGNIKDLTGWLCRPVDDDGNHFDISFDGNQYKKNNAAAQ